MKSNIRVSFCTDFSETANAALEMILFNAWSFKIDIYIIHLLEDLTYKEAKQKLDALQTDLNHSICGSREVNVRIFEKGHKLELITHLNESNYFLNVVGLDGQGHTDGQGSFLKTLYQYLKGGLVVVPKNHEVSIENKLLIALEYNNIERIHYLMKVRSFLYFNFSKLNILIRVSDEVSLGDKEQTKEVIEDLFAGLECEIIFQSPKGCTESMRRLFKEKKLNYTVVFKGDYFDNHFIDVMSKRTKCIQPKEMLLRVCTAKRIISAIKENQEGVEKMELRDF
ncbi:hypothetical protein [uncultured Arcticibacterium sp.]|uniref:hypothetical protein n=1 Tax=uncultured Arcticibacterium sp. TaxID=2173042 RepID=UPI0030FA357F